LSKFNRFHIIILFVITGLTLYNCGQTEELQKIENAVTKIIRIPLDGDIAKRRAEISGLTWYKDQLIILPQYPDRYSEGDFSSIFRIPKEDILNFLDKTTSASPLSPKRIMFDEKEIPGRIPWFQGYESIVIVDDRVYLTIEINQKRAMQALLIEGSISENAEKIVLDEASLDSIPMLQQIKNYAYEAMVYTGETLLIFYEANGSNLTRHPQMFEVIPDNGTISPMPFLNMEYRITDATGMDENGYFWVSNYYWPGDFLKLSPAPDPLAAKSDPPIEFSENRGIERLVQLHYSQGMISFGDQKPIVLSPRADGEARNWEGIVRLDDRGFILVTDQHPETILAFVPFKNN
jgi:hypothetical protein